MLKTIGILAMITTLTACLGLGGFPSFGSSHHGSSNSSRSSAALSTMPIRSVVILAGVFQVWRQIDADNAADRNAWVFQFESACPLQANAQQLFEEIPKSFRSAVSEAQQTEAWLVTATSSVQEREMTESRLSKWVDSASALSQSHDCRLRAWEVLDVTANKTYRSEAAST